MIRVLIVDDSPSAQWALRHALEQSPTIRVVAQAATRAEALAAIDRSSPDIVLMDVYLGDDNGLDVADEIMSTRATPILVVTGVDPTNPDLAFRTIEVGALELRAKLPGPSHPSYEKERRQLTRLVQALATVPVVTRRTRARLAASQEPVSRPVKATDRQWQLVVIGGSTGAIPVISSMLEALPQPYPLPIAIAQHLANGFSNGFAGWLSRDTGFPVEICDRPRTLQAGTVYLAADNQHLMLLSPTHIGPSPEPDTIRHRPSIDQLFSSSAKAYGANTAAVILSGMGNDGEKGARTLQAAGALCIAQHPDTCVIDSMPAHAIKNAGVDQVLTPAAIAAMLARLGESYGSNPGSSQNAQRKSGSSK